jgi:hypothetical protein
MQIFGCARGAFAHSLQALESSVCFWHMMLGERANGNINGRSYSLRLQLLENFNRALRRNGVTERALAPGVVGAILALDERRGMIRFESNCNGFCRQ